MELCSTDSAKGIKVTPRSVEGLAAWVNSIINNPVGMLIIFFFIFFLNDTNSSHFDVDVGHSWARDWGGYMRRLIVENNTFGLFLFSLMRPEK